MVDARLLPLTKLAPVGKGHVSLNLTLRRTFNLFANVRPCASIQGFKTPYDNVDTVLIRENTEGEYSGIEHEVLNSLFSTSFYLRVRSRLSMELSSPSSSSPGTRRNVLPVTHSTTRNPLGESGLRLYIKPTSCETTNNMLLPGADFNRKMSDGMFLSACRQVSKDFPAIAYDEDLLDRVCLQVSLNNVGIEWDWSNCHLRSCKILSPILTA